MKDCFRKYHIVAVRTGSLGEISKKVCKFNADIVADHEWFLHEGRAMDQARALNSKNKDKRLEYKVEVEEMRADGPRDLYVGYPDKHGQIKL